MSPTSLVLTLTLLLVSRRLALTSSDDGSWSLRKSSPIGTESTINNGNKLQTLIDVAAQLHKLNLSEKSTLAELTAIYETVAQLAPSDEPISELEATTVSQILGLTSDALRKIPRKQGITSFKSSFVSVVLLGHARNVENFLTNRRYHTLHEDKSNGFFIDLDEFLPSFVDSHSGILVYPPNACPLRPLPPSDAPVTRLRLVDMVLGGDAVPPGVLPSTIRLWWDMKQRPVGNTKYGCARRNKTDAAWSTLGCTWYEIFSTVNCLCDIVLNGDITEYVIYQYEAAIQKTIRIDKLQVLADNLTRVANNYSVYAGVLSDIFKKENSSDMFVSHLYQYLSNVMTFDSDVLTANAILEDIGKILEAVKPDQGRHTIGQRNNLLTSFVVQSDLTSQRDLPIGFGVYSDYTLGIECFMSTEDIDPNKIFSDRMSFSLLFSKSVTQHNTRYGFLVYPQNKYLKPLTFIKGVQVKNYRVVDIVLTECIQETTEHQLLHMYNGFVKSDFCSDCAYWRPTLNDWTNDGCYVNPGLFEGVCTCKMAANFNESVARSQYIVYKYFCVEQTDIVLKIKDNDRDNDNNAVILEAMFYAEIYKNYPKSKGLFYNFMKEFFFEISIRNGNNFYYKWRDNERRATIDNVRKAVIGEEDCYDYTNSLENYVSVVLCSKNNVNSSTKSGFSVIRNRVTVFKRNNDTDVVWTNQTFVLRVSESVLKQNERHAFLLYPESDFFWPLPSVVGECVTSRVVDVILKPKGVTDGVEQHLEFTSERQINHTLGCGIWDDVINDWKTDGCRIGGISSVEVCNCSLSATGGQYIVYIYKDVVFYLDAFTKFHSKNFTDPESIFDIGAALIHNASQLTVTRQRVSDMIFVYQKLLWNIDKLPDSKQKLLPIIADLSGVLQRICPVQGAVVHMDVIFPGDASLQSEELPDDLFSNAVLSSKVSSKNLTMSDMIFMLATDTRFAKAGIKHSRGPPAVMKNISFPELAYALKDNPLFACFVKHKFESARRIFLVYPMNVSPYSYTMTESPIFNFRQVDVFHDTFEIGFDRAFEVYFQPTDNPKSYLKIACAAWDDVNGNWSHDICTAHYASRFKSCLCNFEKNTRVTRTIIYEYTDEPNFSLNRSHEGTSVVYLIGSTLSLLGLAMIATTAVLIPDWREELSNKILIQLSVSHFLYLALTMFRETHTIYADLKRLDVGLVIFVVFVHYTRLVHHCWGLVMSVLQYKRFSGVVGASTVSHLLLKISAFAWGVPILPLAVLLSWDVRDHFCTPHKLTHYMLYLVPVVVITLLNIGLLVAIVRVITNGCGLWDDDELQRHGGSKKDTMKRQLKQTVMMFFLFGIPAVFEMFNDLVFHSTAMVYINKALDPVQGFVMFLFFVVINDKTRESWNTHVFGEVPPPVVKKPIVKITPFKLKPQKKAPAKRATVPVDSVPAESGDVEPERVLQEIEVIAGAESEDGIVVKYEVKPSEVAGDQCEVVTEQNDSEAGFLADSFDDNQLSKLSTEEHISILFTRYQDDENIISLLTKVRERFRLGQSENL